MNWRHTRAGELYGHHGEYEYTDAHADIDSRFISTQVSFFCGNQSSNAHNHANRGDDRPDEQEQESDGEFPEAEARTDRPDGQ